MTEKKFKYLVADTTAFINHVQLNTYAENILTVPDVVNEVKNKRQIRRLVVLPFDLQVREPNSECLAYVTNFAKKTGDFPSLSSIDLKVIALTYELEKENVGSGHLREEPILSKVIASKTKPEVFENKTNLVGFYNPNKEKTNKTENDNGDLETKEGGDEGAVEENLKDSFERNNDEKNDIKNSEKSEDEDENVVEEQLRECLKNLELSNPQAENDVLISQKDEINSDVDDENESEEEIDEGDEQIDDDDDSWITPSNIKQVKRQFEGDAEDIPNVTVACMTTDFAIQNVLKQINLSIAALDGRIIKHLRTYILRCYACFKRTSVMTKIFCPNCGNKTLKRVAVSLDENGQQVIHINTRRPLTSKYKNQSLPRFKGGKHSCNPILFEDQPIPKQMPSRVAKTKTCALDDDYIAGLSPFVCRDVDSKSALLRTKGNIKQWARNNEYEELRRKKQFNRLVK